jgi:hypothetical protein
MTAGIPATGSEVGLFVTSCSLAGWPGCASEPEASQEWLMRLRRAKASPVCKYLLLHARLPTG